MPLISNQVQIGTSGTPANNFVLQSNGDGTAKLSRGVLGATTQDVLTIDANGLVTGNQGIVTGRMVLETAKATTSGTAIDFTGIPSWVKRITVMLNGVSTNGTSDIILQLGAGSIQITGYLGVCTNTSSASVSTLFSVGLPIASSVAAAEVYNGMLELSTLGTNKWNSKGVLATTSGTALTKTGAGGTTLSGTLDRIRLTTVNGTDAFDAGSVNIMYEG